MKKRICLAVLLLSGLMVPLGCNIYTDPAAYHYTDCKTPPTEYARYYRDYGGAPGGPRCGCCGFIASWAPCGQWCNQVQDDPCDWMCPCACAN